jgi:ligand-binding sensor domain-containing protein/signal transduction histidine kinase
VELPVKKSVILIIWFALSFPLWGQKNSIRFERIGPKQGLTNSVVHSILQDKRGFMWFGTQGGLFRFDGYKFQHYRHNPKDPLSLPGINVLAIYESKRSGQLWIGTDGGGLSRFNREQESFIRSPYKNPQDPAPGHEINIIKVIYEDNKGILWLGSWGGLLRYDPNSGHWARYRYQMGDEWNISNSKVRAICQDSFGLMWIGTEGGLNVFNPGKETFEKYLHDPNDAGSLNHNVVRAILEDSYGHIWIGTNSGLNRFDSKNKTFKHFTHSDDDPNSLGKGWINSIFEDESNKLWIGTDEDGLNQFKVEENIFLHYRNQSNTSYSISNNAVLSIIQDNSGSLWLGTYGGGVNRIDPQRQQFGHFSGSPDDTMSINSNDVTSFRQDKSNRLWVGTSKGLNRYDESLGHFVRYDEIKGTNKAGVKVMAIYEDYLGILWIGTWGGGLKRLDQDTDSIYHYDTQTINLRTPNNDKIFCINEDLDKNLWIGTWGGGLNQYNRDRETFTYYEHSPEKPNGISSNGVTVICPDLSDKNFLWIGTYNNGVDRFNRKKGIFQHFPHSPGEFNSLSNNAIRSLYVSPQARHVLWVGTRGGGLNRYDLEKKEWTHYTYFDGLPSNTIYGILEDEKGLLWLSTTRGLSRFNPKNERFSNYGEDDGLQGDEFNQGAAYKGKKGRFYFGGINGYNSFFPDRVSLNPFIPPIEITNFRVLNREKRLLKSILETDEIHLDYEDYIFTFEFAALNYTAPLKNQYRYKMEGLDEEWIQSGNKRDATYTRLAPGSYVFRVKGSNNDGIWNPDSKSVSVIIHPPFWDTWWFKLLGMMLLAAIIILLYKAKVRQYKAQRKMLREQVAFRTQEIQQQKEIIEGKNEALERSNIELIASKEELEEVNATKDKFFSIISHDLKNHLTTIMGPADLLANNFEQLDEKKRFKHIQAIDKSAIQLYQLLKNLLQWARSQRGALKCKPQRLDIGKTVDAIFSTLEPMAAKKKINLSQQVPHKTIAYADKNMIHSVITNLVSNAIKFTEKGGEIQVIVEEGPALVIVSVKDNGVGIPPEKRDNLFEIGKNESTRGTAKEKGTGLGLILCKEFIEKNNGKIWYEVPHEDDFNNSRGSLFCFTLPKP